ncbi:HD-GYP domain-containing protein [Methylobacterium sp. E-066]|uniref:HD-GYP domain-containing protein n=1 Tax=Methylobacterium sp. E-066 TaxID=2836584 RepID=UPI001FBB5205|nr:HD domain-containing phosphohydrolase [Methylobacterium sp. E-066]MCJ2139491.1 HD domain-containing protein [Methylobacterium sp. E-066]
MGELLLITDDIHRGRRLARDLGAFGSCRIHDLYDEATPSRGAGLIVSDVEGLNSEALVLMRRILERVRDEGMPYLFLVHGNVARAEAQARILGATATLPVNASARLVTDKLAQISGQTRSIATGERQAVRARQFFAKAFFSGRAITIAVADTGTELIIQAIRDVGIHDWVQAVQRFDDVTHQHCLLVAGLAAAFSGTLGFGAADRHRLAKAALLHDVGKTKIPTAILNKPGKLDPAEMAVMRTHPAEGYAMLAGGGFDASLLAVVRSHHEMLDGSGYPDGLRGAEIPDLVRLVTICDIHAALIERRPYKAAMDAAQAYAILDGMAGRLDADLVRAFRPVAVVFDRHCLAAPSRAVQSDPKHAA